VRRARRESDDGDRLLPGASSSGSLSQPHSRPVQNRLALAGQKAFLLESIMSSSTYRLTQTHRRLDDAITYEMNRRLPDSLKLLRLKKLRLAVKDRLATLMRRGFPA
jgi:hypothetical protein